MKNVRIGDVLKEAGVVSEAQLEKALAQQKAEGGKKRLGETLVDMKFVTEKQVLEALAKRFGYPVIDLDTTKVEPEAVTLIPKQLAQRYCIIAIKKTENRLTVVMNDPLNFYAVEDVRQITGAPLEIKLSEKRQITNAINQHYAEAEARGHALEANMNASATMHSEIVDVSAEDASDASVVKLLNSLLTQGFASSASDIHIEPHEANTQIRIRIDGVIIDYVTLPRSVHQSLIARIKIISGLDIAERRLPQDGHFRSRIEGYDINIRTSVIPTVYGEKAVLRFLSSNSAIDNSATFGMDEHNYRLMQSMLRFPHGIIYLTGPTGSGKTTTLYMILEELSKRQVNISTIEDPVEKNLPKINQMQVNNVSGLTFELGLRALLRQDPDVIMVGETRDSETAQISVRAAITGHLVFSTLHTNDAVSSIVRLEDMGLPDYLVASSVVGIVAQRLVRKICPYCKKEHLPDESERALIGPAITRIYKGEGCNYCKGTGYKGRIAVHETLPVTREIRRMIVNRDSVDAISDYAKKTIGMRDLRESTLELVKSGVTTVEELLKVSYSVE
ncbi:MAG: GspE/PulE family protein [Oscillospiraceae bacterium]|nr:GspE/PulE family protein [Oscillospiraceae bacterium]